MRPPRGVPYFKRISLPRPMPHQQPILLNPARHKVVVCGRRFGKTSMGLMATVRGHGPQRGSLIGAIDGGNIWWVAPTFPIAGLIWRLLKRTAKEAWVEKSEMDKRIEFPGGGSITVKSADNADSLRGEGLDGLVVDEAAYVSEDAWKSSLRPALADKRGWSMHISTPNGFNWFKDLYDKADRLDWARWKRPTSDNPLITKAELDEALLDMGPVKFAQEHLAEFTDIAGAAFSAEYFHDDMWFQDWPNLDGFVHRVQSCDPSLGRNMENKSNRKEGGDYQAHVLLGLDPKGMLWVEGHLQRRDRIQIVGDMIEMASWFHPEAIGIETNQWQVLLADQLHDQSRAAGLSLPIWPRTNWDNKVIRMRATLTPYLSRHEFMFRDTPGTRLLVEQLRGVPVAKFDDGPDALEVAVKMMRELFDRGPTGSVMDGERELVSTGLLL